VYDRLLGNCYLNNSRHESVEIGEISIEKFAYRAGETGYDGASILKFLGSSKLG
jgi:hypothetical protein